MYQVYISTVICVYGILCIRDTQSSKHFGETSFSNHWPLPLFIAKNFPTSQRQLLQVCSDKNWSMVSPYAAFATFPPPQKKKKTECFGHLGTHTSLTISRPISKTWPFTAKRERRLCQIANPPLAPLATPGFSLRSQFCRTQLLQDFAQFGTRCGTLFRLLLVASRSKPPRRGEECESLMTLHEIHHGTLRIAS